MFTTRQTSKSLIIESDGLLDPSLGFGRSCSEQGALIGKVIVPLESVRLVGTDAYLDLPVYEWEDSLGICLYRGTAADLMGAVCDVFNAPKGCRRINVGRIQ